MAVRAPHMAHYAGFPAYRVCEAQWRMLEQLKAVRPQTALGVTPRAGDPGLLGFGLAVWKKIPRGM